MATISERTSAQTRPAERAKKRGRRGCRSNLGRPWLAAHTAVPVAVARMPSEADGEGGRQAADWTGLDWSQPAAPAMAALGNPGRGQVGPPHRLCNPTAACRQSMRDDASRCLEGKSVSSHAVLPCLLLLARRRRLTDCRCLACAVVIVVVVAENSSKQASGGTGSTCKQQ